MVRIICDLCSKKFLRKPSQIKRSKNRFCSTECQYNAKKKGQYIGCFICKKRAYKQQKDLLKSQSKKYFCGRVCSNKWHGSEFVGEKHPNWIDGRFVYKNILLKTRIKTECFLCGNRDTEVLVAHHIDQNRKNNSPKNLIWLCHNCHHLVHNYRETSIKFLSKLKSYAEKKV